MRGNSRSTTKVRKIPDKYTLPLSATVHLAGPRVSGDFQGTTKLIRLPYTTIHLTSPSAEAEDSFVGASAWVRIDWPAVRDDGSAMELRIFGKCVAVNSGELVVKMFRHTLQSCSPAVVPAMAAAAGAFDHSS